MSDTSMGCLAVAMAVMFSIGTAAASDFCTTIDGLTQEAKGNFAGRSLEGRFTAELPDGHECALALQLGGGRTLNCQWPFGLRDPQARETFKGLAVGIEACAGTKIVLDQDQQVNHPDTYDLRKFDRSGVIIDVSLKDKGALQQTFVFLRVSADPSN